MSKSSRRFIQVYGLLILILMVAGGDLFAQRMGETFALPPEGRKGIRILWYNAENLFHPSDDSLSDADDDFTVGGNRGWNYQRYRQKLTGLAKVIIASGSGDPPGIVGLCEIENSQVVGDLAVHPILEPYGYRCVHSQSDDHRGMDVACLYRPSRVEVVRWRTIPPAINDTRDILHLQIGWGRGDTLDLFLVHLISKYRGTGTSALMRREQAGQLAELVRQLAEGRSVSHPEHRSEHRRRRLVILAGDWNDPPDSYALEPLLQVPEKGDSIFCLPLPGSGCSYKYQGEWSVIDRFFISGIGERYRVSSGVVILPVLMEADAKYGGVKPFRTFQGYAYHGGFSDHLPVWLDISRRFLIF